MPVLLNAFVLLIVGIVLAIAGGLLRRRGSDYDTLVLLLAGISATFGFALLAYFLILF